MFLNNNEEKIISVFMKNLDGYDKKEMKLIWNNIGTISARFDTCFEDDNECDDDISAYEEFVTFVFELINTSGNPPVFVTEDNFFCINYHNFPDIISVDDKIIN